MTPEERDHLIEELSEKIQIAKEDARPIDDTTSRYLFALPGFCQKVVRTVMEDNDLQLKEGSIRTQHHIHVDCAGFKDVDLDVYAEDVNHNKYNIEIQRDPRGATTQRADYNRSMMRLSEILPDPNNTESPRKHVIFICEKDPSLLNEGKPVYRVFHSISGNDTKKFDTDIFVNCAYQGELSSPIIELAHNFVLQHTADMTLDWIAQPMRVLKGEGGNDYMPKEYQQWIIDLRQLSEAKGEARGVARGKAEGKVEGVAIGETKKAIEAAKNMLRDGVPFEKIASYVGLSIEKIKSLQTEPSAY